MNILAVETASEACSVALAGSGFRDERYALAPRGHAERVLPWVEELLAAAGLQTADLDAIAFSRGPGSFTSLRIGISVVQGLAWASGVGVVPLSSLQVTAQVAAESGVREALVAMDARMGEVFCGEFRCDDAGIMRPVGPERVCSPGQAAVMARGGLCGVGNGFERFAELEDVAAKLDRVLTDAWPRAGVMLQMAEDWLRGQKPLEARQAQPVYLRDRVAEKPGQPR